VRDWLDNWMFSAGNRTLVYVGRDYDAAPAYWKKVMPQIAADQQQKAGEELKDAETAFLGERARMPVGYSCEWFDLDGKLNHRDVRTLSGPWSDGVDAARLEIELNGRLKPPEWAEHLLDSDGDALAWRASLSGWQGSQFIGVANGSFLLNEPLVNHEHRKLAGRLVAAIGHEPRRVVFLESSHGGPPIHVKDPTLPQSNLLEVLGVWPLGAVLLHLAALGVIFAFVRWPIFGRPLVPTGSSPTDFGKHVIALGQLLARTRNRSYAQTKIDQWREAADKTRSKGRQAR
jgi:hypothetical protein